ncbi:MAG: 2-oxoacid:acceptor oxidoreductase subunit alpha [Elusimicrobia bacterium]|nr:2-oxoacid:acceptor oxidoreductase subunit alpha [Elusimicrobiota bacterium]
MSVKNHKDFFSWVIGGPQGSGINLSAELFAKALSRAGLKVFANIEYHSNIKGKHSDYRLTIGQTQPRSHDDPIDFLVALDEETLCGDLYHQYPTHRGLSGWVVEGGGILYDSAIGNMEDRVEKRNIHLFPMPYLDVLEEALRELGKVNQAQAYKIMKNVVAFGASAGAVDFDFSFLEEVIRGGFPERKKHLADMNVVAARKGYEYARREFAKTLNRKFHPLPKEKRQRQMVISGTQAVAIAKLRAGCALQTYYPISPATDESAYLEKHQRSYPLVIVQTEDEVSAVDMASAAALGGVRASTSTSGPGFALMPEGIGFASITEAGGPVLCLYQRSGPSTGIPTRTEQADLRFALHAGQGDFPKLVLAAGDIQECFEMTFEAFNWADRYQMPVLLLFDKHLASQMVTLPPFPVHGLRVDRGRWFDPSRKNGPYLRYALTEDGISPRSRPGLAGGQFWATSDEHNETGHISEGVANRIAMMAKRMGKEPKALSEIAVKYQYELWGPESAEWTWVFWGSSKGVLQDAAGLVSKKVRLLQIKLLHPFPREAVRKILSRSKKTICFDQNYSSQLAGLVREKTGLSMDSHVVKYDGRPISRSEVLAAQAAAQRGTERIVVSEGRVRREEEGIREVRDLVRLRENSRRMQPTPVPIPPGYNQ